MKGFEMTIKSKRTIMGVAALLILIFHFYIPIFKGIQIGRQIASLGFIGVDLFFFVSGISCGKKNDNKYLTFLVNRLISVWLPFATFSLVAAIYAHWAVKKYFLTVFGIELFTRGGSSFCWFLPGIMLFYIVAPFFSSLKRKWGMPAFLIPLGIWLVTAVAIYIGNQFGIGNDAILILVNRLPIFILGMWFDKLDFIPRKLWILITAMGLTLGSAVLYYCCIVIRTNDSKYLLAIPFVLGAAIAIDKLAQSYRLKIKPLQWLGGFTLELYALQMIFGFKLIGKISKVIGTNAGAFWITVAILAVVSFGLASIKKYITRWIEKKKKIRSSQN